MSQTPRDAVALAWDAEYANGRYRGEPPLPFVNDILAAARERGLAEGVYVGCGNGRNYVPLVESGLDLMGLDLSCVAIEQLASRMPERRHRLLAGDLSALPVGTTYGLLVGIQVFQHGLRAQAKQHIRQAQEQVALGGLFCIRVNAESTDVYHEHSVVERDDDGSFTVRYLAGPKRGLDIHFFAQPSLAALFEPAFALVSPPRLAVTRRRPPETGSWSQWEAIWCRREPRTGA